MPNVLKSQRGTSLVEVVLAILILTIVIVGGSLTYFHARGQIHLRKQSRAAVQLASQRMEELKAENYENVIVGETEENIALDDLSCRRHTETILIDDSYKKVKVTTFWQQKGMEYDVSLVTFIAPKE